MARELQYQATSRTGQNLYAVIDFQGLRWNGSSFVIPAVADGASYAIPLTEDTGTGHFTANVPAGITAPGLLNYVIYYRAGATPAVGDMEINYDSIIWNGSAQTAYDQRYVLEAMAQGMVAAATHNTITFSSQWAPTQDLSGRASVNVTYGPGRGQQALILSYNPTTHQATIENDWLVLPTTDSYACIFWNSGYNPTVTAAGVVAAALTPDGLDQVEVEAGVNARRSTNSVIVRPPR